MIEIYDELGYIKNILEHGIDNNRWRRDTLLLARFYSWEGIKKSECKKIIKDKLNRYVKNYNEYKDFQLLNKIIDNAYSLKKQGKEIRNIKKVVISRKILNWFLDLETKFTLTDQEIQEEYNLRKIKLKKNPMNFNRVKFLFTLYIWGRVKENYIEISNLHYLKKDIKRFKNDADLGTGFRINVERNILYDLGFLYINNQQGIDTIFIKKNKEIFNITDQDELIEITGDDLYNCGYWLKKQKFGYFNCKSCGKEVAYDGNKKGDHNKKYCNECAKKIKSEQDKSYYKFRKTKQG